VSSSKEHEIPVKVVDRRWWARGEDGGEPAERSTKPTYVEELERQVAEKDRIAQEYIAKYRQAASEFEESRLRLRREISKDIDRVFATFPRLKERATQLAGTMSGGEQQMLAMGRALMARPKVLLLDEPSMGLSPIMVDKIFEVVKQVYDQGVTVLLVEQNASRALQLADRGYVMESGLITMSGDAKVMLSDPKVRAAYLGE